VPAGAPGVEAQPPYHPGPPDVAATLALFAGFAEAPPPPPGTAKVVIEEFIPL